MTKQSTENWHRPRDNAKITGSTFFRGIGCATLKEQQEHYDKVYNGLNPAISRELQTLFDYGTENEINAIATTVGKLILVYYPGLNFVEEGCNILLLENDSRAVVSGDGYGMDRDGVCQVSFEFKCPSINKKYSTDVPYTLPIRYSPQILAEMVVKNCKDYAFISFTPESTTFIKGRMNEEAWNSVWNLANDIYGTDNPKRPTRKHARVSETLSTLGNFSLNSEFVVELPSLIGSPCHCDDRMPYEDPYGHHVRSATREKTANGKS